MFLLPNDQAHRPGPLTGTRWVAVRSCVRQNTPHSANGSKSQSQAGHDVQSLALIRVSPTRGRSKKPASALISRINFFSSRGTRRLSPVSRAPSPSRLAIILPNNGWWIKPTETTFAMTSNLGANKHATYSGFLQGYSSLFGRQAGSCEYKMGHYGERRFINRSLMTNVIFRGKFVCHLVCHFRKIAQTLK